MQDDVRHAAKLIAGKEDAARLVDVFGCPSVCGLLKGFINSDRSNPVLTDTRAKLAEVEKAAETLAKHLGDRHLFGELENALPSPGGVFHELPVAFEPGNAALVSALTDLKHRAAVAGELLRTQQGRDAGRRRLDRGIARVLDAPHLFCAALVIEAWRAVRGREPSRATEPAQAACEAIWTALGGAPAKDGAARWQRHLADARARLAAAKPGDMVVSVAGLWRVEFTKCAAGTLPPQTF